VLERAPEQHRDDEREDDHFLEGAGVEGAEALEHADQQGAERRRRVAGQAAEDGGDEAFQADQEAGVVEDRRRRPDEQPGQRAHEGGQAEAELAAPTVEMPISRAPRRLTAVARRALPRSVRRRTGTGSG
jgi:hypothetical protein